MPDLIRDLERTTGDRYRCPFCDARRGLSFDADVGDSGVFYCFACHEKGDGVDLYAHLHHADLSQALDAFGISRSDSDISRRVKRKEEHDPRPEVPEKTDAEWREMTRLYHAMTAEEIWLRDQYRRRRAKAIAERDQDAFDRWHGKWKTLHEHVMSRELTAQREIDRLDADTEYRPDK